MIGNLMQLKIDAKQAIGIDPRESIQEWSDFMKTSSTSNFRSRAGKIMMGLVLASMIGGMDVMPAFGDNHRGRNDRGRYEHRKHKRHVYRHYDNRRVYVRPRVIYVPPRPRGIDFFFPRVIIHP